jgi:NAD(P)-dependent dehydrogenase (short-subunit alcohol dehydrogenase family)
MAGVRLPDRPAGVAFSPCTQAVKRRALACKTFAGCGASMVGMTPSRRLQDKVAIITGGEGSIGMATARAVVAEGGRACLIGLVADRLRAGAASLGDAASWAVADVTDATAVKAAVAGAVERFGRLDVVISNAGISGVIAPVADYPEEVFDQVLAVHVRGSFLVCKYSMPYLGPGASIVITSSVVGLTSDAGICAYAAAKHAQVGLMRTLAKEAAPRGIRVNTIHPGPVDNTFQHRIEVAATGADRDRAASLFDELIPLSRHAAPDEVARAMLFLASDDSSFVTGATLAVDGGMSI